MLIDRLESIITNKHIRYKYYLNDTTKPSFLCHYRYSKSSH